MGLFARSKHTENTALPESNANAGIQEYQDREKDAGVYDDSPVKFLSMRSLAMGVLVSMGGFIFGYDTGMNLQAETHDGMEAIDMNLQVKSRASSKCPTSSIDLARTRAMELTSSAIFGLD